MKDSQKTTKRRSSQPELSRRDFIGRTAAAVGAFTIVPRYVLAGSGQAPPSEKLNIAAVGVGSQGITDVERVMSQNIVALCDVDDAYMAKNVARVKGGFDAFPKAKKYRDFRKMLEKQKDIDAVLIATPDHTHAVVSMTAIKMGKHVYCEKPLTHTIYEARQLAEAARQHKVATQMGNRGQAAEGPRLICEWIWDGAIGPVRQVHVWTDRPVNWWPQGIDRPKDAPPVPETLDWDLWLGPAPYRPYHPAYAPYIWRGWWDFGTGALGDMGCHSFAPIFWALKLGYPTTVEASSTEVNSESYPLASIVRYKFPARGDMPPVELTWYDGGLLPPRPEELEQDRQMGNDSGGIIFIGDKGKIMTHHAGRSPRITPESKMKEYKQPPKTIPRSIGHFEEWLEACKGGKPAVANFDFAGPVAEVVLLGNIALRPELKKKLAINRLYWDGVNMKVTNLPEANEFVHYQYRQGWSL